MELHEPQESGYPIELTVKYPERSSRLYALLSLAFFLPKLILLVPHLIILWFLSILSFVLFFIAQIAVLLSGNYPAQLFL